jgi:hypothetical protein
MFRDKWTKEEDRELVRLAGQDWEEMVVDCQGDAWED